MKKNRSVYAGVLCGVLVAALILSGLFVTTHLDHDCTGKNCSVCAMIFSCEQLIRSLTVVVIALLVAVVEGARAVRYALHTGNMQAPAPTLVALKVKLSD